MVKKQVIYTVIFIFLLLLVIISFEKSSNEPKLGQIVFPELDLRVQVEIAETKKQRAQGLMLRRLLAPNKGMLFIFEHNVIQSVWMKNTLIALDVIFISDEGVVVSTIQDLKPCLGKTCKVHRSNKKARYMLEVNAGVIKKTGVSVGQKIIFDSL